MIIGFSSHAEHFDLTGKHALDLLARQRQGRSPSPHQGAGPRTGPRHVTVNAVATGPFPSKMMAATLEVAGDAIAAGAPLRRIRRDDDMAGIAVFLASRAGSYLTGAVIPVDGFATTASGTSG